MNAAWENMRQIHGKSSSEVDQPDVSGGEAARPRTVRSLAAEKRYHETQRTFAEAYSEALRKISALDAGDGVVAQARAIARATVRAVEIEGRRQNLAMPLSRENGRMADALLQIETAGQKQATLNVSNRPVVLRRVIESRSLEITLDLLKGVADRGLGADRVGTTQDQIGMSLSQLRRTNRATPRHGVVT